MFLKKDNYLNSIGDIQVRAREFLKEANNDKPVTINISITLPAGMNGGAVVSTDTNTDGTNELPEQPVQVFPLQQELELKKHQAGLRSPVLNQLLQDKGAFSDVDDVDGHDLKEDFDLQEDFDALQETFKKIKTKRRY